MQHPQRGAALGDARDCRRPRHVVQQSELADHGALADGVDLCASHRDGKLAAVDEVAEGAARLALAHDHLALGRRLPHHRADEAEELRLVERVERRALLEEAADALGGRVVLLLGEVVGRRLGRVVRSEALALELRRALVVVAARQRRAVVVEAVLAAAQQRARRAALRDAALFGRRA